MNSIHYLRTKAILNSIVCMCSLRSPADAGRTTPCGEIRPQNQCANELQSKIVSQALVELHEPKAIECMNPRSQYFHTSHTPGVTHSESMSHKILEFQGVSTPKNLYAIPANDRLDMGLLRKLLGLEPKYKKRRRKRMKEKKRKGTLYSHDDDDDE